MKVVLVHDYLKEYGGAERVLEVLLEIWPEAPVFTLVYLPKFLGPHQERFKTKDIRSIIPSWMPLASKLISPLRLIAPRLFGRLDLTAYDVVIVSATGAYNPNLVKTKKGSHFCYCHTPPRYLYGLPTARDWKKHWWIRIPAEITNHFLRMVDFHSAQKVDWFIANSWNTKLRIEKFYRKDSVVIYPPVEASYKLQAFGPSLSTLSWLRLSSAECPRPKGSGLRLRGRSDSRSRGATNYKQGNYFLAGGRLARPKRIDLAVKACTKLNLPLKVFGRMFAGYGKELKAMAGLTVKFLGEVNENQKAELFVGCKAFIFPAEEEDFGIVAVEAMGFGKPVIALRQGGVRESIIEGKTGEFFDKPSVESLIEVLKRFKPEKYKPEDCMSQAKKFSKIRFKREIQEFVKAKCCGKRFE